MIQVFQITDKSIFFIMHLIQGDEHSCPELVEESLIVLGEEHLVLREDFKCV